jgi:hypothetical protein
VAKEEYAARAPFYLFILEIHVILAASFFGAARVTENLSFFRGS